MKNLKKILIFVIAIGLVVYIITDSYIDLIQYGTSLNDLPNWSSLLVDLQDSTRNLTESWNVINQDFSIFNLGELISSFFNSLWNIIILPFRFIYYLISTLFILIPIS